MVGRGPLFDAVVGGNCSLSLPATILQCECHSARHIHRLAAGSVKSRAMILQFAFQRERSIYILHFFQLSGINIKCFIYEWCQHKILQLDKWQYERRILLQVTHIMLATLQIVTILLKRWSLGIVLFPWTVALL